jgi:hypothetical protein
MPEVILEPLDLGTYGPESVDYPDFAHQLAHSDPAGSIREPGGSG